MRIDNISKEHDNWRKNCVNLVPSENIMSDYVRSAFLSDFGHRYYFQNTFSTGSGLSYEYRGTKFIAELYQETLELAKSIFKCSYANIDMHSGHLANLNILLSFCKPGDTICCTDTEFGGYPGLAAGKLPSYLGLKSVYIPQTEIGGEVDLDNFKQLLRIERPKIVMLSSSITIFPFAVREVSNICKEFDIPFCYDASHPLGLIAGGEFQSPFDEGADMMIGSTHKSFPGPQGGIILSKEYYPQIEESTDFVTVDNIHLHRIAALCYSLRESQEFGRDYASQIIKNTKALAIALEKNGFEVKYKKRGYSESHQLLLDTSNLDYPVFTQKLERCNIISDNSGRLGTNEMTRYGMKEGEMDIIAGIFASIRDQDSLPKIKQEVLELRENFKAVQFTFN